ncbi:MAG: Maf family protein [Burkholderiales bacterium]|jgi:septum formation protein|nr:Maf family protein [Burkholderiales bacterium]MCE1177270.1 Maf family protein [Burkholderiales bacterium]
MNPFHFPKIYLASQSPRRAELLKQIGVPFEVVLPHDAAAAERLETPLPDENPVDYVQRVCLAKAQMMQTQITNNPKFVDRVYPILCADTTVVFENRILGKPTDAAHAAQMLRMLSGNTHEVYTAVALASADTIWQDLVRSTVRFHPLSENDIQAYIASGEPFGKAGAYAIQGYGACWVAHLSGSFSAVKGLPIFEVARMLRRVAQSNVGYNEPLKTH